MRRFFVISSQFGKISPFFFSKCIPKRSKKSYYNTVFSFYNTSQRGFVHDAINPVLRLTYKNDQNRINISGMLWNQNELALNPWSMHSHSKSIHSKYMGLVDCDPHFYPISKLFKAKPSIFFEFFDNCIFLPTTIVLQASKKHILTKTE